MHASTLVVGSVGIGVVAVLYVTFVIVPRTRQAAARLRSEPVEVIDPVATAQLAAGPTELDRAWAENVVIVGPPGATADPLWTADDLAEIRRLAWGGDR
jgi:hypothetical protein